MKRTEFRYIEMAGIMRTEIMTGYLKPGEFLLPEKDLCEKYSISRNSLRQALDLLTEEGLLVKMVGRGNMVAKDIRTDKDLEENTLVVLTPYPSAFAETGLPLLSSMFKRLYPNVNVKIVHTGHYYGAMLHDLDVLKPDIILGWDRHFHQMGEDQFIPVDDLLEDLAEHIHPKLVQAFEKDGVRYAVPVTYSPIFLACNTELFHSCEVKWPNEGWSTDEFVQAAKRMTRDLNGDGMDDNLGFGLSNSIFRWPIFALIHGYTFGGDINNSVQAKSMTESFSFMQSLVYRDRVCSPIGVWDFVFLNELFAEGRIGMILTSTLATDIKRSKFPIAIAPLPKRNGASNGSLLISNGLLISKRSRKTNLAKLFLKFSIGSEFQRTMANENGFLSIYPGINTSVWPSERLKAMGASFDDLDASGFIHELFPNPEWMGKFDRFMKKFWAGIESPSELMERLRDNGSAAETVEGGKL